MHARLALCALSIAVGGATGCVLEVASYRPMPATPEAFNAQPAPAVRVTRQDGTRISLDAASLVGDSVVGQSQGGQASFGTRRRLAVAVADTRAIEMRRTNWPATLAVTGVATAAAVVILIKSGFPGRYTWRQ